MKTIEDNSIDAIITDPPYGTTACKWDNVFEFKRDRDNYHPTQKPVLLLEDLIKTFSNEGDLV